MSRSAALPLKQRTGTPLQPRRARNAGAVAGAVAGVAAAGALLALVACSSPFGPPACTTEARPGITVQLRDAVTGLPPDGPARVVARDGSFADTATFGIVTTATTGQAVLSVSLVHERAGTYAVLAEHAGYQPWRRDGIRVSRDGCHVRTVQVAAHLQPLR